MPATIEDESVLESIKKVVRESGFGDTCNLVYRD